MTHVLSVDPGGNTGIALGYYDPITPYQLVGRWQVHGGVLGFVDWWHNRPTTLSAVDQFVCESFSLREENNFAADLTPVHIEGALATIRYLDGDERPLTMQPPSDKGNLVGYPKDCKTKVQRQRYRFDFLDRFGLFVAGTENDDSNDAITHALVFLKRKEHGPTQLAFWPDKRRNEPVNTDVTGIYIGQGF